MGLMTFLSSKISFDKSRQQRRAPPYERKPSPRSPVRVVQTVYGGGNGSPTTVVIHRSTDGDRPNAATVNGYKSVASVASASTICLDTSAAPPSAKGFRLSALKLSLSAPTIAKRGPEPSSPLAGSASRGHVDLLDALSEFKPSDFHDRVKASGARDYGEDVADRNIGVNGHHLDSLPVQEFYAHSSTKSLKSIRRNSSQRRPFTPLIIEHDEAEDAAYHHGIFEQPSMDPQLWQPVDLLHTSEVREKAPSVRVPTSQLTGRASRCNTLDALSASSFAKALGSAEQAGWEDACSHDHHHMQKTRRRTRSLRSPAASPSDPVLAWDSSASEMDLDASVDIDRLFQPDNSSRFSPTSLISTIPDFYDSHPAMDDLQSVPYYSSSGQPILSPQPTSFRLSAAVANSTFTPPSIRRPSSRQSTHSYKRPAQTNPFRHAVPDVFDSPLRLKERVSGLAMPWQEYLISMDEESAPSPSIKTSRSRSSSHSHDGLARTHNAPSVRPRSRLSDIGVQVPIRVSSIRHGSMSSTTPTICSSNSTAARPQSQHTTSTSVDLNMTPMPSKIVSSFEPSGPSSAQDQSYEPATMKSSEFNLDDYVSSDDDSFVGSSHRRGEGEEDLLFDGGYGSGGQQLPGLGEPGLGEPGLGDASAAPAPVVTLRTARVSAFASSENLDHSFAHDTAAEEEFEKSVSEDIMASVGTEGLDPEPSDGGSHPQKTKAHHAAALAALQGHQHVALPCSSSSHSSVESLHRPNGGDKLEKMNIARMIRLRKENKASRRASLIGISLKSRKRSPVNMADMAEAGHGKATAEKTRSIHNTSAPSQDIDEDFQANTE